MEYARFTEDELDELKSLLEEGHKEAIGPLSDFNEDGTMI